VVYQGGIPVITDVAEDTLLLDTDKAARNITDRTKAIIAVDYAGQPCEYEKLEKLARMHDLVLIDDACHALGGRFRDRKVGSLADISTFSFHPVKHITTGEGGMLATADPEYAARIRKFRNHGLQTDHAQRERLGTWYYEMTDLGYNYRLTDFQCALGQSQLRKLDGWIERRREIADFYSNAFSGNECISPLTTMEHVSHAYHLYVVRLNLDFLQIDRSGIFRALRAEGIGVNVHYIPVHLHPYYKTRYGTDVGNCPVAEYAYERILSLPIFPAMTQEDVDDVVTAVEKVCTAYMK